MRTRARVYKKRWCSYRCRSMIFFAIIPDLPTPDKILTFLRLKLPQQLCKIFVYSFFVIFLKVNLISISLPVFKNLFINVTKYRLGRSKSSSTLVFINLRQLNIDITCLLLLKFYLSIVNFMYTHIVKYLI